jgi:hypothetical protein
MTRLMKPTVSLCTALTNFQTDAPYETPIWSHTASFNALQEER